MLSRCFSLALRTCCMMILYHIRALLDLSWTQVFDNLCCLRLFAFSHGIDPGFSTATEYNEMETQAFTLGSRKRACSLSELCLRKLQRSSCARPVRTDSFAASRISSTCTFNRAESGSSISLSWRMQSTKYATGLLVAPCDALSVSGSPSSPDFPRSSADR